MAKILLRDYQLTLNLKPLGKTTIEIVKGDAQRAMVKLPNGFPAMLLEVRRLSKPVPALQWSGVAALGYAEGAGILVESILTDVLQGHLLTWLVGRTKENGVQSITAFWLPYAKAGWAEEEVVSLTSWAPLLSTVEVVKSLKIKKLE